MTGIHSKAATKEYRDNHSRIFGLSPLEKKWLAEEEANAIAAQKKKCKSCKSCECDEAVCYSGENMMPTEDGNK